MEQPAQPVNVSSRCGYQQIGQENYVTIDLGCGSMAMKVVIPIDGARALAKMIAGAAEAAATALIKPASLLAPN